MFIGKGLRTKEYLNLQKYRSELQVSSIVYDRLLVQLNIQMIDYNYRNGLMIGRDKGHLCGRMRSSKQRRLKQIL